MAAKALCCTANQDERSSSPPLPNARIGEATPARRPLLSPRVCSQGSRFTSARTEDLHELHHLFENATDSARPSASPEKKKSKHVMRSSAYSLRTIHRIKSVHAMVKKRLSKDLSIIGNDCPPGLAQLEKNKEVPGTDTVIKVPAERPKLHLKLTKADLRQDLLSDKRPEEGGYDSDAEVLDDVGRQVLRSTPQKRPSVHSINWTPSNSRKPTPEATKGYTTAQPCSSNQPYDLVTPDQSSKSAAIFRFGHVSSPNLRFTIRRTKERKVRRSYSASSIMPRPSSPVITTPVTAIRLPSISGDESDEVPWAVTMHESLRVFRYSASSYAKPSRSSLIQDCATKMGGIRQASVQMSPAKLNRDPRRSVSECTSVKLPVDVKLPMATPQLRYLIQENTKLLSQSDTAQPLVSDDEDINEQNPRDSVHLHGMRISHHLRSGSLLSWDALRDKNPSSPTTPRVVGGRSVSCQMQPMNVTTGLGHDRKRSSSGFASSQVPVRWGRVVPQHQREEMSSIYSSRPHSPPDSFGGSLMNLSASPGNFDSPRTVESPRTTIINPSQSRSGNLALGSGQTPRSPGAAVVKDPQTPRANPATTHDISARNNSGSETKISKFREEFTPTPPRKKSLPALSLIKAFLPRLALRSQSDSNLKSPPPAFDGTLDVPSSAVTERERRLSQSITSMQKEHQAAGKQKDANPVWEKALKAYQDERSAMFLPSNKPLAREASPFRERSVSTIPRPKSLAEIPTGERPDDGSATGHPMSRPGVSGFKPTSLPELFRRRSALFQRDHDSSRPEYRDSTDLQIAYSKQKDTAETVGFWGRYPSHTRRDRTGSAGVADSVQTRDFALEAAIRFARGEDAEDAIDPTERPDSPLSPNGKKRKKRLGPKSNSMTFGKTFLKNYAKIFRSQSIEFHRHGHGHRSSIATGGNLEYPELEILPEIWSRQPAEYCPGPVTVDNTASLMQEDRGKRRATDNECGETLAQNRGKEDGGQDLALDGTADTQAPVDRARVWSVYYEDCMPDYPRMSNDRKARSHSSLQEAAELQQEFGTRHSLDSRHTTMHSKTMPARLASHGRHGSRVSRVSVVSTASMVPSSIAASNIGATADAGTEQEFAGSSKEVDLKNIVSVRRSTMDLANLFKQQEASEREKVLGLMRMNSARVSGVAMQVV